MRFYGSGSDHEIHDLGRLVHEMKNLGPHRSVTDFHGSRSDFSESWAYMRFFFLKLSNHRNTPIKVIKIYTIININIFEFD